jgi:tellurite resistance protein TerB
MAGYYPLRLIDNSKDTIMLTSIKEWLMRHKNEDFMQAIVASCALVAAADGTISEVEKNKMAEFIQRSEELHVFPMTEVVQEFNKFADTFKFNSDIGKQEALKCIRKVKKNPDAARMLIRICCQIGLADGNFDDNEKLVVSELCLELGLNADYYKAFYLKFD